MDVSGSIILSHERRAWSIEYAARLARREVERDEDLNGEFTDKSERRVVDKGAM